MFTHLILISERETSVEESLCYELTQVPMNLYDNNQQMRKANKAALETYLKKLTNPVNIFLNTHTGGWLLHQVHYKSGQTYGEIGIQLKKDTTMIRGNSNV